MIQCPSCGKDIADDSAHCGFCGAKIETGSGKKTMIGFAALTGDVLKQAAEEARKAREAEAASAAPKKLTLPTPATAPAEPSAPPALGKLKIPQPSGDVADDDAATNALPSVGGAPSTVSEAAIADAHDTDPMSFGGEATASAAPTTPIGLPAEETLPEVDSPSLSGPSELGALPASEGPTEFGSKMQVAPNTLPEKKKNPALMLLAVVGVIVLFCCLATIAWSIFPVVLGAL